MYPSGVGRTAVFRTHLWPADLIGSNSQIWLVMPVPMSKPPIMYDLLLYTARPPGTIVPMGGAGHGSVINSVIVSATGSNTCTRLEAVVPPPADPPTM